MMNTFYFFETLNDRFTYSWKKQLLHGILLILFGIAIVIVPQLLVALIASIFIAIGVVLIGSAWMLRRWRHEHNKFNGGYYDFTGNW